MSSSTVVIGAGPTGLSATYHLGKEALLLEQHSAIGGWCRSFEDGGFTFDYAWDANGHPANIYCRSDHYNYARWGIPVTFFTTGGHFDYHMLTDEPQYIDYDKVAKVSRLIASVAKSIGDRPERQVAHVSARGDGLHRLVRKILRTMAGIVAARQCAFLHFGGRRLEGLADLGGQQFRPLGLAGFQHVGR